MKMMSKEALVLGGIYSVLSVPFAYFDSDIADTFFVLYMIMICFNKTPKFITKIIGSYPKTAYYLASFGWLPYFVLIVGVAFIGSACFVEFSDEIVDVFLKYFLWILNLAVPVSLIVAYLCRKFSK